jgi:O-antigen ligase
VERRLVHPPMAALFFGALVLWGAVTAAWALSPDEVFSQLRTALSLFVLYLAAVSFKVSRKELTWVCVLTVGGGAASAAAASLLGVADLQMQRRATLAVGDHVANANAFAVSLLLPMAMAIGGLMVTRTLLVRIGALASISIIGYGIYISMSRGTILALLIVVAFLMYRVGLRWQMLVVVLVFVALLGAMSNEFFDRATAPFEGRDTTGSGRTQIWQVGLSALDEFWLFGAGLSNFPTVYARHAAIGPGDTAYGAHNIYLATWVELGVPGLVLLIAAIVSHLSTASRLGRGSPGRMTLYAAEAACVGILAASFFGDRLWSKGFWMVWLLLAWTVRLAREDTQARTSETAAVTFDVPRPSQRPA